MNGHLLLNELKEWLKEEQNIDNREVSCLPIMHNTSVVYLQFSGWSINLYSNGTWIIEDTTGG